MRGEMVGCCFHQQKYHSLLADAVTAQACCGAATAVAAD